MSTRTRITETIRRHSWAIAATVALLAALAIITVAFEAFSTATVHGTPVANHDQVIAVQQEKAASDAKALADQQAAEMSEREDNTRQSMQATLTDPANGLSDYDIVVSKVTLIWSTGSQYDGMATMSANGGTPRDIPVHVTDDGRSAMFHLDAGALLPLLGS